MTSIDAHSKIYAWIALLCIPLTGMTIDIYVPSLPNIQHYFQTTSTLTQLSITTYLFSFGLFQLIAGGLSDSLGRRWPLLINLALFMVVSFIAVLSSSIYQFLGCRFLQGIAMASISVSSVAILPDLFQGKTFLRYMSYTNMVWTLSPILAPYIGGYLQAYWGWQAPFYFLTIYSFMTFIFALVGLRETHQQKIPLNVSQCLRNYATILKHPFFLGAVVCLALLYGMVTIFSVVGPFLIQSVLQHSPIVFGRVALLMGVAIFLGNYSNRLLQRYERPKVTVQIGLIAMIVSCLVLLYFPLRQQISLYNVSVPIFLLLYSGGLIFPTYFAQNIALFPTLSGSANAMMGALFIIGAAVMTGLAAMLRTSTQLPIAVTFLTMSLVCAGIFYGFLRKFPHHNHRDDDVVRGH